MTALSDAMTDRELLYWAAKAAGISGVFQDGVIWYKNQFGDDAAFNPLTDDGAALRLAVKLAMTIDIFNNKCVVENIMGHETVVLSNDMYAATRRAIVRAAAEIGATL